MDTNHQWDAVIDALAVLTKAGVLTWKLDASLPNSALTLKLLLSETPKPQTDLLAPYGFASCLFLVGPNNESILSKYVSPSVDRLRTAVDGQREALHAY